MVKQGRVRGGFRVGEDGEGCPGPGSVESALAIEGRLPIDVDDSVGCSLVLDDEFMGVVQRNMVPSHDNIDDDPDVSDPSKSLRLFVARQIAMQIGCSG